MDFENYLADLAADLDSRLDSQGSVDPTSHSAFVEVAGLDSSKLLLAAPLIGYDFIGGLVAGSTRWRIMPLSSIAWFSFLAGPENLPRCKFANLTLLEYLEELGTPISLDWIQRDSKDLHHGLLLNIREAILLIQRLGREQLVGIPLVSISQIILDPQSIAAEHVNNSRDKF
jgi:hypothetical protein